LSATTLVAVLCGVLFLHGCNRGTSGDDVVAKVNGEKILRSELEKYYSNQTNNSSTPLQSEQAASLRLSILKQLIEDEIMMQRARKLGLLATDEEVDAKLNEYKAPYTQEEFDKQLKDRSLSVTEFKVDLRRNLTIEKLLNKEITSKIAITDSDITTYYNEHKTEFNLIEPQYHLAQILVTTFKGQVNNLKSDKATNEAEARKKIQMIMQRLDSQEDFATVAMNYSEMPGTSGNGGDMGFLPESSLKMEPQTFAVISKLKAGQYSQPIQLFDPPNRLAGFRIIRMISREAAGQRDLADPRVQAAVRQQLRDRREQMLKSAYYEVIRNQAKVDNYLAEELLNNSGSTK
jgi:peptidyl-prolyl cis-trans isomerase SurA